MKRILIVKVTSLGDIVETLPVVADLRRAFPSVKVDWAADAAFADIIRWNPGVDRVLSAPLRKFKKARNWNDLKDIAASISELRAEKYDVIVDIHGVYKSAIIAFIARGRRRYGYLNQDLGERGAAFAYNARFGPRPHTDAWRGMRVSVAEALGYRFDETPDYNIQLPALARDLNIPRGAPIAMLFHATSADVKKRPAMTRIPMASANPSVAMRMKPVSHLPFTYSCPPGVMPQLRLLPSGSPSAIAAEATPGICRASRRTSLM